MKKRNVVIIVICCIGILIVCSGLVYFSLYKKEPIKIGVAVTLTGASSTAGVQARNGAILATEQINKTGGINGHVVQLIIKDAKANPEHAIAINKELIEAGVKAIVGHWLSTLSVAVVPLLNEYEVVMVATGSVTSELTGLDDQLIRINVPLDRRGPLLANQVLNKQKIKKVTIVYDQMNPGFSRPYSEFFKKEFEKLGGEIGAIITFDSREKFSAPEIAAGIIEDNSSGVFLLTNSINGALICQHLKKNKSEIKIIDSGWAITDLEFLLNGGNAVEGAITITTHHSESDNPKFIAFEKAYEERFGEFVGEAAQMGFEAMQMIASALEQTTDSKEVKQKLLAQKKFGSLSGDLMIDEYGDPMRSMFFLEIRENELRVIDELKWEENPENIDK